MHPATARLIALLLTTTMLALAATGCAGGGDSGDSKADREKTTTTTTEATDSPATDEQAAGTNAGADPDNRTVTADTATTKSCPFFDQRVRTKPVWRTIEAPKGVTCGVAASVLADVIAGTEEEYRHHSGWTCTPATGMPTSCSSKSGGSFTVGSVIQPRGAAKNLKLTPQDRIDMAVAIRRFSELDRGMPGPLQKGAYYGSYNGVAFAVGCQGPDCTDGPRTVIRYPGEDFEGWGIDYGMCWVPQPLLDVWKVDLKSDAANCIP
ncbi:MAG: hypothetical protein KDC46_02040 [Thermoleophilia bacterium]|nr:hypothetical protein [Thermoleophilia bacterium]